MLNDIATRVGLSFIGAIFVMTADLPAIDNKTRSPHHMR